MSKGRKRKPAKAGRKGRARRPDAVRQPRSSEPAVYLEDVPPQASEATVQRVLDRRRFTMPSPGATIDPADPDGRALLIEGEHPELAEPGTDTEPANFTPRFHLTMHEVIANQLWDDDPPEVWQAAQRLRDQGMERHEILHALMDVMVTHMRPTLTDKVPFDTDAYRRDLDDLGRSATSRTGPSLTT